MIPLASVLKDFLSSQFDIKEPWPPLVFFDIKVAYFPCGYLSVLGSASGSLIPKLPPPPIKISLHLTALLYPTLHVICRLLTYPCQVVSQFVYAPTSIHWAVVLLILCYLLLW